MAELSLAGLLRAGWGTGVIVYSYFGETLKDSRKLSLQIRCTFDSFCQRSPSVPKRNRFPISDTSHVSNSTSKPDFFRLNDRATTSLRATTLTPDYVAMPEGSVLIAVGNTRVLCNATVEQTVPGWLRNSGKGWVTAEYSMLPRATLTRTPRESERGKIGGRTHEIQRLIGRSLRSVVDLKALGERSIILDCDVLQADGGTRTAAITGACAALALALNKLVASGTLPRSPLKQLVAATSVGIVEGNVLLDLAYEEDSQADVDMNVVMTASGGFVETQATAEKEPYTRAQLATMLDYAQAGIAQLIELQRDMLAR